MWIILITLVQLIPYCICDGKINYAQSTLNRQFLQESAEPEPIAPYSFSYVADAIDGRSSRDEVSDGTGVVRGSYSILGDDGIKRIVTYIADENGFRAKVQTNEPGTESKSPANVVFESSQPLAEELALKFGSRPAEGRIDTDLFRSQYGSQLREELVPKAIEFSSVVPKVVGRHPFPSFTSAHRSSIDVPIITRPLVDLPIRGYSTKGQTFGFSSSVSHISNLESKPYQKLMTTSEYRPLLRVPTKTLESPVKSLPKLMKTLLPIRTPPLSLTPLPASRPLWPTTLKPELQFEEQLLNKDIDVQLKQETLETLPQYSESF